MEAMLLSTQEVADRLWVDPRPIIRDTVSGAGVLPATLS